ncbi:uncharacterized protein LOC141697603 isoform X6 [Apium graveolens]|uniref:uncharacterized protein LOC141697603 isoform X6 n=1 Tax=Apium graveolens TaxID=4045 RepID=UPI003D7BAABC
MGIVLAQEDHLKNLAVRRVELQLEFQAASQLLLYTLLMLYSFSCSYLPCSYGIGCIERRLKELHRLSYKELCASEDMANGSLDNFLYGEKWGTLSWKQRLDIIFGIARDNLV